MWFTGISSLIPPCNRWILKSFIRGMYPYAHILLQSLEKFYKFSAIAFPLFIPGHAGSAGCSHPDHSRSTRTYCGKGHRIGLDCFTSTTGRCCAPSHARYDQISIKPPASRCVSGNYEMLFQNSPIIRKIFPSTSIAVFTPKVPKLVK